MPRTGHFILHAHCIPRVLAGSYELVTEQHEAAEPFRVEPEHTHLHVASPRYTLPPEQIISTFPPANATGAFSDRLPQIVMKRRTLPWERNPAGGAQPSHVPWLALVVVADGEAELSTPAPVTQCFTAGTPLFAPADRDVERGIYLAVTETVVRKVFPCAEDLPLLAHVREVDVGDTELAQGDDDGWLAVVLANRMPVFDRAAGKPVRYLACLVNLEGQLDALPPREAFEDHFTFERAQDFRGIAARFATPDAWVMGMGPTGPLPNPRALAGDDLAHATRVGVALDGGTTLREAAVSQQWASATVDVAAIALDPDAKRLVRDGMAAGFRLPIQLVAQERVLRFPVLAHWSFTTDEGATFESLMAGLDVGLLGSVEAAPDAPGPRTRAPVEVVETGHIGLGHRTRRGDAVRAWYRGPLVPFPTLRDEAAQLAHSADQLRRVVPDGREDLSLASAFEIGRLLGLSQLSVVSALLRFRGEQFGAGRVHQILKRVTRFELPALRERHVDLGRFVALQAVADMLQRPEQVFGPRRPVVDPGRALLHPDQLDTTIAAGLGLDLTVLRERSESMGLLAALAATEVPLAYPKGERPLDEQVTEQLTDVLHGELERVLKVAAPKRAASMRTGKRRAPAPDALDELIARADAASAEET